MNIINFPTHRTRIINEQYDINDHISIQKYTNNVVQFESKIISDKKFDKSQVRRQFKAKLEQYLLERNGGKIDN